MFKRPVIIFISLLVAFSLFSAAAFVWQTYNKTQANISVQPVDDYLWKLDSRAVNLDQYIAKNQISQLMIDKKQRLILKPELIRFNAVLQAPIKATKADLVSDALGVWAISPLPEVGFSTYIRSPEGQILAVYVENAIAEQIKNYFTPEAPLQLQAYRLYNYAKGPRLLLVGIKAAANE